MIIGVTGNIFSGKTTVAKLFKTKGARVIDADKIAHSELKRNKNRLKRIFGFKPGDRKKIAEIVFRNKNKLRQLCKILHPAIISKIKSEIAVIKKKNPRALIIVDAPLLIESGLYRKMDKNIVVTCSKAVILRRAAKKGMPQKEVLSRLSCQLSEEKKKRYADFIINNNKSLSELKKQVNNIYQKMR